MPLRRLETLPYDPGVFSQQLKNLPRNQEIVGNVVCQHSVRAASFPDLERLFQDHTWFVDQFQALNPGVACPALVAGHDYCVIGSVSTATSTTVSSATTVKPTTSPSTPPSITPSTATTTSAPPYSPTQSGPAANCNSFYLVSSGDTCDKVDSKFGICFAQFRSWNPSTEARRSCEHLCSGQRRRTHR